MTGENQLVDASPRTPDGAPVPPPAPGPVPPPAPAPASVPAPSVPSVPAPSVPSVPAPSVPPEQVSRARRLALPAFTLASVVGAFAYVGTVDPNEPGHYPVCPLFRLTGVLCPGCGGLRSAHAFAHGDLVTALGANAMAVVGYFGFAAFVALWLVRAYRGAPAPRVVLTPRYWWAVGAVALVFSVIRNLPFGSALAP
ncbi:DUF2752 domain-containing protein [Streptomyces goshikiensis]|uniref:DUF2752 domain-containing protein n=1 Tax=Streptomyces goshikiensis TaxID=1942 RepID=UPI0037191169